MIPVRSCRSLPHYEAPFEDRQGTPLAHVERHRAQVAPVKPWAAIEGAYAPGQHTIEPASHPASGILGPFQRSQIHPNNIACVSCIHRPRSDISTAAQLSLSPALPSRGLGHPSGSPARSRRRATVALAQSPKPQVAPTACTSSTKRAIASSAPRAPTTPLRFSRTRRFTTRVIFIKWVRTTDAQGELTLLLPPTLGRVRPRHTPFLRNRFDRRRVPGVLPDRVQVRRRDRRALRARRVHAHEPLLRRLRHAARRQERDRVVARRLPDHCPSCQHPTKEGMSDGPGDSRIVVPWSSPCRTTSVEFGDCSCHCCVASSVGVLVRARRQHLAAKVINAREGETHLRS
jgi:hypothetical protein